MNNKSDVGFLKNLAVFLWSLPAYLWHCFGCCTPAEYRRAFSNQKPYDKRMRALGKIEPLETEDFQGWRIYTDLTVIDVEDVPRGDAVRMMRDLKLDLFCRYGYSNFDKNISKIDLKKVTLTRDEYSIIFYINKNSLGDDEEFAEVEFEERMSLIVKDETPLFLYNHASHILINCDYWDLYVRKNGGVMLQTKDSKDAEKAQAFVMDARENGLMLGTGKHSSRVKQHHHSYDELPLVQKNPFRKFGIILPVLFVLAFGMVFFAVVDLLT